ncbi:MAG: tetratricopeptide repeat protein [Magnetococcales bacterium]|nr:tetratricopeptide repeat protein [Magnetococcales bacterium]
MASFPCSRWSVLRLLLPGLLGVLLSAPVRGDPPLALGGLSVEKRAEILKRLIRVGPGGSDRTTRVEQVLKALRDQDEEQAVAILDQLEADAAQAARERESDTFRFLLSNLTTAQAERLHQEFHYQSAAILYRQSLEMTPDWAVRERIHLLTELGSSLRQGGKPAEAEAPLRQALALSATLTPPDPLVAASPLQALAVLLRQQGRIAEGAPFMERALTLRRESLGDRHPLTAEALHKLALIRDAEGRFQEAEDLFHQALELRQVLFGVQHPETAQSLDNLGAFLRERERLEEAEPLLLQALRTRMAVLGAGHLETAATLNNLGLLHQAQGHLDQAETRFRTALAVWTARLNPGHPNRLATLNNLALLKQQMREFDQAAVLLRQGFGLAIEGLGRDHPRSRELFDTLRGLLARTGRCGELTALLQEDWTATHRQPDAREELPLADCHMGQARALREAKRLEEAEGEFQKALAIMQRLQPGSPLARQWLGELAGLLRDMHQTESAAMLEQLVNAMEKGRPLPAPAGR